MKILSKILACLIALYGIYTIRAGIQFNAISYWISGIVIIIGAVGLFFKIYWSQYIIYLLSLLVIVKWFYLFWQSIKLGNWPYETEPLLVSILSLIPGIFLILFSLFISFFTFKYFKKT